MINILDDLLNGTPAHLSKKVEHLMELAASIVERLEAKGLSKADLARRLDMEPPQLTRILSGSANVTMETIARLETALGENLIIIPVPSEQRIPFEIQSQETTEIWGAQAFLPKYKMADCRG